MDKPVQNYNCTIYNNPKFQNIQFLYETIPQKMSEQNRTNLETIQMDLNKIQRLDVGKMLVAMKIYFAWLGRDRLVMFLVVYGLS